MTTATSERSDIVLDASPAPFQLNSGVLESTQAISESTLRKLTVEIDREGLYPRQVLQDLGQAGVFAQHLASQNPAAMTDLNTAVAAMGIVSRECMSTGFMTWCQDVLGWYLENSENTYLQQKILPQVATGNFLGGTALSNPMKYFSNIEPLQLSATPVDGGYVVNGTLPWVSNLGPDHYFGAIARTDDASPREIMFLVPCASDGFQLLHNAEFTAMEGTGTFGCQFRNCFIPETHIIADPVKPFIQKIKAGFIMLQGGMALGVIESCIDIMREVEPMLGHVNRYLEDRPEELAADLDDLSQRLNLALADPYNESHEFIQQVIQLRLEASELSLRAAHSAMLHTGARGYLAQAPAQRKLREAYFVAIVTPAIKHLRKELDAMVSN
ncbi:MAG: acyl-CoA/acyl-ACP dehydrogenase [Gammaproteobacteria bacterium]|jgi:alkylation response protein AidB-like acyl-CoA dehydrogenase